MAVAAVGLTLLWMLLWFAAALLFRCRFQYGLRSLFLLVVAVAVPCSWLATEIQRAKRQQEVVEAIGEAGAVEYDYQRDLHDDPIWGAEPPAPAWLRTLLGDHFFATLASVNSTGQAVTDAQLAYLNGATQIKELCLGDTKVTDAGLVRLQGLTQLQRLWLDNTQVTDEGLVHLRGLGRLKVLYLTNTQVTDGGVDHLKGLNQLLYLELTGTKVTEQGVKRLQQVLPNCRIER